MLLTVLKNVALRPLVSSIVHDLHDHSVSLVRLPGVISLRSARSRRPLLRQLQTPGSSDPRLMRIGRHLIGPRALMLSRSVVASERIRRGRPSLSTLAAGRRWRRWRREHLLPRLGGSRRSSESLLASVESPRCNTYMLKVLSTIRVDFICLPLSVGRNSFAVGADRFCGRVQRESRRRHQTEV